MALFETRNFEFAGVGITRDNAFEVLEQGWKAHCEQYPGADPHLLRESAEDVGYLEIEAGGCYRDWCKI